MQKHVKAISERLVREFVSLGFFYEAYFIFRERDLKKAPNFLSLETLNTQNRES